MELSLPDRIDAANSSDALDRLIAQTSAEMDAVNDLILSRAESHVDLVPELARYLIDAGGKRLRPMLTIASAAVFGEVGRDAIHFAAAVEFMHNATLLHDDVVDESDMRRGQPAARKVWGNQASVLVGDFLLGQAFLMMVETGNLQALTILSQAAATIAEGEVFQLVKASDLETTAEEYRQIICAKTATLFESATLVGALAGGAGKSEADALGRYGLDLGLAFQLVDDVLDYGGAAGALGKNTGDDLREGKMTLPVILTLEAALGDERADLVSALGNANAGPKEVGRVVELMGKYGALQETLAQAHAHAEAAKATLGAVPAQAMRTLLADIADFCVARAY